MPFGSIQASVSPSVGGFRHEMDKRGLFVPWPPASHRHAATPVEETRGSGPDGIFTAVSRARLLAGYQANTARHCSLPSSLVLYILHTSLLCGLPVLLTLSPDRPLPPRVIGSQLCNDPHRGLSVPCLGSVSKGQPYPAPGVWGKGRGEGGEICVTPSGSPDLVVHARQLGQL